MPAVLRESVQHHDDLGLVPFQLVAKDKDSLVGPSRTAGNDVKRTTWYIGELKTKREVELCAAPQVHFTNAVLENDIERIQKTSPETNRNAISCPFLSDQQN